MRHNPDNIPDGLKIWEYFAEFKRRPELCSVDEQAWVDAGETVVPTLDNLDKMLRFVVYMASQESPHYLVTDYRARLRACMQSSGISNTKSMSVLIETGHWWYRRTLMVYLQTFAPIEFSSWLTSRSMAFNMMEVIMSRPPVGEKEISQYVKAQSGAREELDVLMDKISSAEAVLFPLDEMRQAVATQAMFDEVNTAESYARDFTMATKFQ